MHIPRVLVLLAAFNGSRWISEQIKSILEQNFVEVDLLISDDGSTDATSEIISRIVDGSKIRATTPPLPTGSAAQNFFFLIRSTAADNYDFVALADQDDIWDGDKLATACARLASGDAAAYSCSVRAFWDTGRQVLLQQSVNLTRSDFLFEGAGQGCTFVLTAQFYGRLRALLLNNVALTERLRLHDWAIYAVCRSWRLFWVFDKTSHLQYRQHDTNDLGARASLGGVAKRISLIRNGWYARQLREIADVCAAAAPDELLVSAWRDALNSPHNRVRKIRMLRICLSGGRRRMLDKLIVLFGIMVGWI